MDSNPRSGSVGGITVQDRLRNDFAYHKPPDEAQAARCTEIRKAYLTLALLVVDSTPASRDQSVALTHLEESMRAANAAIAKTWPVTEPI